MTGVLIRRGSKDIQGENHVNVGAGTELYIYNKESPRWPVNYQKLGERCGTEIPSQFSEKINSASTSISDVHYREL